MNKALRTQNGVATIEFALGLFPFWLLVCVWVEMSYVSYISGLTDLALAESSRSVKKDEDSYMNQFRQSIKSNNTLWSQFLDTSKFKVSVHYIASLKDLKNIKSVCEPGEDEFKECGIEVNSAIAIYRVEYNYNPMFNYFLSDDQFLVRESIVIQEYERDEFKL
ncbi:TadE-like protein [Moritella viscosa]|uniref:TadE family protein n=1 Tax=Moritella viscosa TaxID=80854 RepID=UPI0005091C10|nr:TadE family protein [Moritella viscosa]CED58945.1 membrane associated secretion system protein [Moritella viscosa]SHN98661.1 TadE-like protein [Moritella viscosa]SHO19929.1 TadE-like protein [Moritella viscosa]